MRDILIRGMDKPGSCRECDFCEVQDINFEIFYFCNRNDRFLDDEEACNIPNDCPIHELPEHGDLIDRDAFRAENEYYLNREFINPKYEDTLDDLLKDAPVVIPANKEDAE